MKRFAVISGVNLVDVRRLEYQLFVEGADVQSIDSVINLRTAHQVDLFVVGEGQRNLEFAADWLRTLQEHNICLNIYSGESVTPNYPDSVRQFLKANPDWGDLDRPGFLVDDLG